MNYSKSAHVFCFHLYLLDYRYTCRKSPAGTSHPGHVPSEDGHVDWEAMKFNRNLLVVPEVNYTLHDGAWDESAASHAWHVVAEWLNDDL